MHGYFSPEHLPHYLESLCSDSATRYPMSDGINKLKTAATSDGLANAENHHGAGHANLTTV